MDELSVQNIIEDTLARQPIAAPYARMRAYWSRNFFRQQTISFSERKESGGRR